MFAAMPETAVSGPDEVFRTYRPLEHCRTYRRDLSKSSIGQPERTEKTLTTCVPACVDSVHRERCPRHRVALKQRREGQTEIA